MKTQTMTRETTETVWSHGEVKPNAECGGPYERLLFEICVKVDVTGAIFIAKDYTGKELKTRWFKSALACRKYMRKLVDTFHRKARLTKWENDLARGGADECWECAKYLKNGDVVYSDEPGHVFCTRACGDGYLDEENTPKEDAKGITL